MFGIYKRLKGLEYELKVQKRINDNHREFIDSLIERDHQHQSIIIRKVKEVSDYEGDITELKSENEVLKERLAKLESPKGLSTNTRGKFIFFE